METVAKYKLAVRAGYRLQLANKGKHLYDDEALRVKSNFKDVEVTRPLIGLSTKTLMNYSLFTVNGFIHPLTADGKRLFIDEAGKVISTSPHNHVGIMSFEGVTGGLEIIKITEDMVHKSGTYEMSQRVDIKTPKDIGAFFLVFMGYLIRVDDVILRTLDSNLFTINMDRLNIEDKFYELDANYDFFGELGIERSPNNDKVVLRESLMKDETFIKFLTRFNSFIVHFPKVNIDYEEQYLDFTTIPGPYRVDEEPNYPLIGGYGKIIEYLGRPTNDSKFTLHTVDALYDRAIMQYSPKAGSVLISDQRFVGKTYGISNAYMLKMIFTEK